MQFYEKGKAAILFAFCLTLLGCASDKSMTPTSKCALTGAVAAGGIGGIVGAASGTAAGPIGALGGAVIGGIFGACKHSKSEPNINSKKSIINDNEELLVIVEKPAIPTSEVLESIYFKSSSDQLSSQSKDLLQDIAIAINDDLDIKLTINGYADSSGRPNYNNNGLAKRRAKTVNTYLKSLGVNTNSTYMGSGGIIEENNQTVEGRANNRKVDIVGTK